jgi:hypothetical protein
MGRELGKQFVLNAVLVFTDVRLVYFNLGYYNKLRQQSCVYKMLRGPPFIRPPFIYITLTSSGLMIGIPTISTK